MIAYPGFRKVLGFFSRVTSTGMYLPELDGLRFVALASVFSFHLAGYLNAKVGPSFGSGFAAHLHYGVQLFFAISGFILALPFASHYLKGSKKPSTRAYFTRRLSRLEPPYILNLLICFALRGGAAGLLHLLASLTYTHGLFYGVGSTVNVVAWSLEVEVQFYLLAPLLFRTLSLSPLNRRLFFAVLIGAGAALSAASDSRALFISLAGQIQYFCVGVVLADLYISYWATARRRRRWDLVSVCGWALIAWCVRKPSTEPLISIGIFLAYGGVFGGVFVRALLRQRIVAVLGGMCYTFYLYHYILISAIGRVTSPLSKSLLLQEFLVGVPALTATALWFAATEKPFMYRNWWRRIPRVHAFGTRPSSPQAAAEENVGGPGRPSAVL